VCRVGSPCVRRANTSPGLREDLAGEDLHFGADRVLWLIFDDSFLDCPEKLGGVANST
jgi:hypothetical protein